MTQAQQERAQANELPPGSIVSVLLAQHAKIRELFAQTSSARGEARRSSFDELREVLAVHEACEEIVVRPVTKRAFDGTVAQARDHEEKEASLALARLEKLETDTPEFAEQFAALERAVSEHAEAEESEEFPFLLASVDREQQLKMGSRLLDAERIVPTHPHPATAGSTAAQKVVGPFASLLDRARDAFSDATTAR